MKTTRRNFIKTTGTAAWFCSADQPGTICNDQVVHLQCQKILGSRYGPSVKN
jgi:hypothetical protein